MNVRAPGRIPGGSSAGSVAAAAMGACDFALGSDTGGSVRGPAAFCGIYGIRTTHGRMTFRMLRGYEVWQNYGAWITANRPPLGPGIRERMAFAASVTKEDAEIARASVTQFHAKLRAMLAPGTVICLPTVPCVAPRIDAPADFLETFRTRIMRHLVLYDGDRN